MRFSTLTLAATLLGTVSAHFQLQYPPPRGVFNEDLEPTFCGGFNSFITELAGAHNTCRRLYELHVESH